MAYKFRIEETAKGDLDEILDYIINELKNASAANKLFEKIKSDIELLKENPHCMPYAKEDNLQYYKIRKMLVANYAILYVVDDEKEEFTILYIKYAKSDLSKIDLP